MQRLCVGSILRSGILVRSSLRKFSCQSLFDGCRTDFIPLNSYQPKSAKNERSLLSASLVKKLTALQRRGVASNELCSTPNSKGLVLGVYANEEDKLDIGILTENGAKYNEVTSCVLRMNEPVLIILIGFSLPPMVDFLNFYELLVLCRSEASVVCFTRWNPISQLS